MTSALEQVATWLFNHVALFGWTGLFLLAWKARGWLDTYFAAQQVSYDKVAQTLAAVEDAKKVAMDRVEDALKDGAAKAEEIKQMAKDNASLIEANARAISVMDTNHLSHIQGGIADLNGKTDKMLEKLTNMDTNIAILVDRTPRKVGA